MQELKRIFNQWLEFRLVKPKKAGSLAANRLWADAVSFVVIGLVLAFALQEVLLLGLKRGGEGNVGIMNRVVRGQIDAAILISGSSRAMFHYDPRIIEAETGLTSFNIGRNGTKLHEQLELLRLYLKRNKPPAFLIQNLDMMSFEKNDDITDPKQYIAWLDREDVFRPLFQKKRYYLLYRWFPLLAMVRSGAMPAALNGLMNPNPARIDEFKGYVPQFLTWNNDFEKFKARNPSGVRWTIDPERVRLLGELLEVCQMNKIKVILVHSPDYLETGNFFVNRNETLRQFRAIARSFNVPFWDYSEDPMSSNNDFFYNSQHLNHNGASVFSKSIARRLGDEISRQKEIAYSHLGPEKIQTARGQQ